MWQGWPSRRIFEFSTMLARMSCPFKLKEQDGSAATQLFDLHRPSRMDAKQARRARSRQRHPISQQHCNFDGIRIQIATSGRQSYKALELWEAFNDSYVFLSSCG